MTKTMQALRQTGRTTRMMVDAINTAKGLAGTDRMIRVVMPSAVEADLIQAKLRSGDYGPISEPEIDKIIISGYYARNDRDKVISGGKVVNDSSTNEVLFVDHGVYEQHFDILVHLLHEYDSHLKIGI